MRARGREAEVEWSIEEDVSEAGLLHLRAARGVEVRTEAYRCFHPTLFGLDVEDRAEIDSRLGRLVDELKSLPC